MAQHGLSIHLSCRSARQPDLTPSRGHFKPGDVHQLEPCHRLLAEPDMQSVTPHPQSDAKDATWICHLLLLNNRRIVKGSGYSLVGEMENKYKAHVND